MNRHFCMELSNQKITINSDSFHYSESQQNWFLDSFRIGFQVEVHVPVVVLPNEFSSHASHLIQSLVLRFLFFFAAPSPTELFTCRMAREDVPVCMLPVDRFSKKCLILIRTHFTMQESLPRKQDAPAYLVFLIVKCSNNMLLSSLAKAVHDWSSFHVDIKIPLLQPSFVRENTNSASACVHCIPW